MDEDLTQCMNPHGEVGKKTIAEMNASHTPQIMWGVDNLPYFTPTMILDIGCGGGIFTEIVLNKYKDAKACGIDISELCIEYAKEYNAEFIKAGRLELTVGDVADMPYANGTFNMVVSNASHFFWSDLRKSLREINRVSKMGAVVCFTAAIHFDEEPNEDQKKEYEGMTNIISDRKLQEMMDLAGFRTAIVASRENSFCAYIGIKYRDLGC